MMEATYQTCFADRAAQLYTQSWLVTHKQQCTSGSQRKQPIWHALQTELNRVKVKPPYKELKGEGSVSQQADEAWEYAHSRSNSIIQDIFAGQLQSTLQCPHCHAESHTFDEFMDLSLPLPQQQGLRQRASSCTIQVACCTASLLLDVLLSS